MKIILDGEPVSQIRMKYSGRNGIGRIYDPREKIKKEIKKKIENQFKLHPKFIHPRVSFVFHMPIPKSLPKKTFSLYKSGLFKHEKKPDVDNFIKLYLDCMDTICFDGDQKVTLGPSIKLYHLNPKTIIIINEMQELLSPLEVDPLTWEALFGKECGKCSFSEMVSLPDSYTPNDLIHLRSSDNLCPYQKVDTSLIKSVVPHIKVSESLSLKQPHHQL